jgi:hypothetical protein
MTDNAEERVSKFYNKTGWETEGEITEDARRWEDLRENSKEYVSKCRLRVLRHIPEKAMYSTAIKIDYNYNFIFIKFFIIPTTPPTNISLKESIK